MGQSSSSEQLDEDLVRVLSWHRGLRSRVSDTAVCFPQDAALSYMSYIITTTDCEGQSWTITTRYSEVLDLLDQLRRERNLELSMPRKHYFTSSLIDEVVKERREALDRVLAALVPEHAGIPAVRRDRLFASIDLSLVTLFLARSFLRYETGVEMYAERHMLPSERQALAADRAREAKATSTETLIKVGCT